MDENKPMNFKMQNRYSLRYVGGIYWLLDIAQAGVPYREPIPINEVGADIWWLMEQGRSEAEIVDCISAEYGTDRDVVKLDVEQFKNQLFLMAGENHG